MKLSIIKNVNVKDSFMILFVPANYYSLIRMSLHIHNIRGQC